MYVLQFDAISACDRWTDIDSQIDRHADHGYFSTLNCWLSIIIDQYLMKLCQKLGVLLCEVILMWT